MNAWKMLESETSANRTVRSTGTAATRYGVFVKIFSCAWRNPGDNPAESNVHEIGRVEVACTVPDVWLSESQGTSLNAHAFDSPESTSKIVWVVWSTSQRWP